MADDMRGRSPRHHAGRPDEPRLTPTGQMTEQPFL